MKRQRINKKFISWFCIWVGFYFFTLFGYVFVADPWQFFHQPWFREPIFIENGRFQDAGIINNYDFDSAIVGTSMAQNFSIAEASKVFSANFVNLSLRGSLFSERAIILERALAMRDLKNVILSMDFQYDAAVGDYNETIPREQYDFLYNWNRLDDFRMYMDWGLFKCWNFEKKCFKELPGTREKLLEALYHWQSSTGSRERATGIEGWCRKLDNQYTRGWITTTIEIADGVKTGRFPARENLDKKYITNLTSTFDAYVVPYVEQYPEVTFYLFFPPYSRLRFALLQQGYQSVYNLYLEYVEYIVTRMDGYDNVKIFGFETAPFLDDLNVYDDVLHYGKEINSQMLHWMESGEYQLTADGLPEYLQRVRQLSQDYDLLSTADQFKKCLKK
jgi:hypothetical protein